MFNSLVERLTGMSLEMHRKVRRASVEVRCTVRSVKSRARDLTRRVKSELVEIAQVTGFVAQATGQLLRDSGEILSILYASIWELMLDSIKGISNRLGGKFERVAHHPDVARMGKELVTDIIRQTTFPMRLIGYSLLTIIILIKA